MSAWDMTIYSMEVEACNEGHSLLGANGCRLPDDPESGLPRGWMCRKCRGVAQRAYGTVWHNGRRQAYVFVPDHPMSRKDGFYARAKLVMELEVGRYLDPEERVYHDPEKGCKGPDDDRIEVLTLFNSQHDLMQHYSGKYHDKKDELGGGWAALTQKQREAMEVRRLEAENNRRLEREEEGTRRRLAALKSANDKRRQDRLEAAVAEGKKPPPPEKEPAKPAQGKTQVTRSKSYATKTSKRNR